MLIRLVVIIACVRTFGAPARALFVVPPFDFIIPLYDQTPVLFVGWAFLVAKDCRWTATLLASPGPFTAPCDGLTVGIGTNRPQEELTPLWLTVESPGGTGEVGLPEQLRLTLGAADGVAHVSVRAAYRAGGARAGS